MNKTKKNGFFMAACLMLVVTMLATCIVSGTLAMFYSKGTVKGLTATVAKWSIEFNGSSISVEIWKRFRKWGGIPTGITQNVKDLLASREIENIFENSDFIYMLNQAAGDRQILAKQLNISPTQLSYVTNSNEGEGLLFYGNVIIPFVDHFPKNKLYRIMTTKPEEMGGDTE